MEDQTNDQPEVVEETEEEVEEIAPKENETTDDKEARLKRLEENAIRQRERTRALKAENEKLKKSLQPATPKAEVKAVAGELDETQLDYLDLKGITEDDEIAVIQKVMQRTGQTVRQALKDDYVQSKLDTIRKEKEVKAATPSSTRRSNAGQQNDVALAVSKFEQSGILPDDFKLRTEVVNFIADKNNSNKPRWH